MRKFCRNSISLICALPRYATRLQADKALAAGHGSRLTDAVMLGVQKVSDEKASGGAHLTKDVRFRGHGRVVGC